jgi:hypothetical protein
VKLFYGKKSSCQQAFAVNWKSMCQRISRDIVVKSRSAQVMDGENLSKLALRFFGLRKNRELSSGT